MGGIFLALLRRDLALLVRRRQDVLAMVGFFLVTVALFPLGIAPDPETLRLLAPGAVWIAALFATSLSLERLFVDDLWDGSLEQQMLIPESTVLVAAARLLSHWIGSGLPLVLLSPVIGLQLGLEGRELGVLFVALLLGTPVLALLGGVVAALTVGLRGGGALLTLLLLPLYVPVLLMGTAAVRAAMDGNPAQGPLMLLGAALLLALVLAPLATAAALRIAME